MKVASLPTAVEAGTAAAPVRLTFLSPSALAVGTPVQVEIDAEEHANVVLVPTQAIVREADEAAVLIAVANKAQRRPVVLGIVNKDQAELKSGVKVWQAGDRHGAGGAAGRRLDYHRKTGRDRREAENRRIERQEIDACAGEEMSVASSALRYSRACALVAVALVVGGVISALSLPSSIYPPLQFPRSSSSRTAAPCLRAR